MSALLTRRTAFALVTLSAALTFSFITLQLATSHASEMFHVDQASLRAKLGSFRSLQSSSKAGTNYEGQAKAAAVSDKRIEWNRDPMYERTGAIEILTLASQTKVTLKKKAGTVCRIYGAVVDAPGILRLPNILRENSAVLQTTCGLHPASYTFSADHQNSPQPRVQGSACAPHNYVFSARNLDARVRAGEVNESTDSLVTSDICSEYLDSFTHRPLQRHFPHFVDDVASTMRLLDEIYHPTAAINVSCVLPSGKPCAWLPDTQSFDAAQLQPAIILEEHWRVLRETPYDRSWIKQFVGSLAPRAYGGIAAALLARSAPNAPPTVKYEVPTTMRLRSVITGYVQRTRLPSEDELFVNLQLNKKRRCVSREATRGESRQDTTLRVLILNRAVDKAREIVEVGALKKRLEAIRLPAPLKLEIFEDRFEESPLKQQAALINAVDVVIGAHGAGLANVIFMRTNAIMLEIFPFAYRPYIFAQQANAWKVQWRGFMADPDEERFASKLLFVSKAETLPPMHTSALHSFRRLGSAGWQLKPWPSLERLKVPLIRVALRAQRLALSSSELDRLASELHAYATSLLKDDCSVPAH
eukprot:CAMPEP_0185831514 /NCGR_PEP_ID=MMETSP1353-20130828/1536_1 /TAXON_ID=1077150 /ORGANISM="Erythrolobus australicus, Strain CCMP3124" /LENGTH=586 /DNA_ID=CAMNT_0028529581 /DNA_START=41 /DNA_END=1801 /DNA_ORIENTATION=-